MNCNSQVASWIGLSGMLIFSILYIVLAAKSFDILSQLEDRLQYVREGSEKDQLRSNFRGGKAACVLSIMAVILYSLFCSFLSLSAYFNGKKLHGAWYGIFVTASIYSSAFMLLTGIVLQANQLVVHNAEELASDSEKREYKFAFIMAYVMTASYVLSLVYVGFQRLAGGFASGDYETMENHQSAEQPVIKPLSRL